MIRRTMGKAAARIALAAAIAIARAGPAAPQAGDAADPRDRAVGEATRSAVVESVAVALTGYYVFPDAGERMAETIRRRNRDGAYAECLTLFALAQSLTEDLRSESGDGHLRIMVRPDAYFEPAADDTSTDEEAARVAEEEAYENFGFLEVKRLRGNVGYLRMNGFYDAGRAGPTAAAAMAFLAHSDAVLIDLRLTLGGSPTMDQLLASWFFDRPTRLSSFHRRMGDSTDVKQHWTQPFAPGADLSKADLFILTSEQTPSAAEAFAYDMKHLGRATIVGDTTAGAAHPCMEHVFPDLNLSFDVPFARAVHPVTGTDWEGTGVIPDIAVPEEEALAAAHLAALERIRDRTIDDRRRAGTEWALDWVRGTAEPARLSEREMEE
ncbi:MAG: S41 family peptidase [Candidatus Eisenbacteria bacterium]|nr:S41 family peptidase [Candidatus Eisenbacteria bacterium]